VKSPGHRFTAPTEELGGQAADSGSNSRMDRSLPEAGDAGTLVTVPRSDDRLDEAVSRALDRLLALQSSEGYWVFDLEADATISSEYVLLQRFLGRRIAPDIRERLVRYLRRRQRPDGGWPIFEGGPADLSASVKAYFALKLSGDPAGAPHMDRARRRILASGGASRVNVFTRITLALFGQMPWRAAPAMPVEIMLLPDWFFFHLRKVSYWSRTVIVPLLILYAKRPVVPLRPEEGVPELFAESPETLRHLDRLVPGNLRKNAYILLDRLLKRADRFMPRSSRDRAIRIAEEWTVGRMSEGGIGAIFPAMANAVMALKALGYPDDHPDLLRGIKALDDLLLIRGNECFCQPCNSPVWDTAISLMAALEAGLPPDHPAVASATRWLFDRQVFIRGDWADCAPGLPPGGWAFQFDNPVYPDVDDTAMVLMAILRAGNPSDGRHGDRIARGVNWILGMQSTDGGWGAFDVDNNRLSLNDIPFADHGALLDPSTSDLTGRCVELLAMLGWREDFPPIARALSFLRKEQEPFGAWYGRWGVNYIYGTWSVLAGLKQMGADMSQPDVRRAASWFAARQNPDGGWGEACRSYNDPSLAGEGPSVPSQTAWALLGLMAAGETESRAVRRGIRYLLDAQNAEGGWNETSFTGTGFPRVFYLRYHGYRLYFPLWALGVYRNHRRGGRTIQDAAGEKRPPDLSLSTSRQP
jgi:squalene-hopene/tetraprenyl-beta-curcumene cyclase